MSFVAPRYVSGAVALAGLLAIACAVLAWRAVPLPAESALFSLRGYDSDLRDLLPRFDAVSLRRVGWLSSALGFGMTAVVGFLVTQAARLEPYRDRAFTFLVGLGSATSLFLILWRAAYEAAWYPLQRAISNPASLPIFGHRLLLVWPAQLLQSVTHAGARPVFFLVQAIVITATTSLIIRWASLFIGPKLAWMGGPLLVLFLAPTFVYLTFFDVGVVFFHCLGLWALHQRRWSIFVGAVAIGTLNHENIVVLVLAGVAVLWNRVPQRISIGVPALALAAFLVVRLMLNRLIPLDSLLELHVWTNAVLIEHMGRTMIESLVVLAFSFGCAAIAIGDAGPFLRRAAVVILPQLMFIAFVAGRFNEARNFEAFIPILIALVLSMAKRQMLATIQ